MTILTHATPIALWHQIIRDAESACTISLETELEAYLTLLLMRYVNQPEAVHQLVAIPFLEGIKLASKQRGVVLQDIGDRCLLLSGLFPQMAQKRLVKISYFVQMGQAAYFGISKTKNDLYSSLSIQFVPLMDVLQSIGQQATLQPLDAYEQWNDTHSLRALRILNQYTNSIPLGTKSTDK